MANEMIADITKRLDLEIGEEFHLRNVRTGEMLTDFRLDRSPKDFVPSRFKFTDNLLVRVSEGGEMAYSDFISDIVIGTLQIVKVHWKPALGEKYWTYNSVWEPDSMYYWSGADWESMALKCGCVFKTKEEAVAARSRMYREVTGKEWKGQ